GNVVIAGSHSGIAGSAADFGPFNLVSTTNRSLYLARLQGSGTAVADYDGDGKTDIGVYGFQRYAVALSGGGTIVQSFGCTQDRPVVGDYDGDGKPDVGVYGFGRFAIALSGGGSLVMPFGGPEDQPIAGDYDGDGKTDVGVYGYGRFAIILSGGGTLVMP